MAEEATVTTTTEAPALPLEVGTPVLQDKRLILTVATMVIVALNKKLGLSLGTEDLLALSGMAAAYITQSQWGRIQQAKAAGKAAASGVTTVTESLRVLGGPGKALVAVLCLGVAMLPGRAWADSTEPVEDIPSKVEVVSGSVVTPQGATIPVGQGCFLDSGACIATAKELASLRAENVELQKGQGSGLLVVGGLVVLGIVGGYALARVTSR
jgi:hypothetical protein